MQALQFTLKEKKLELNKVPIPKISRPDEILVKVSHSGVCGTDIHIIQGEFPVSENTITLGHEFSGVVVEVGSSVTNFKPGDNVSADPNSGCHRCKPCHSGNSHFCKTGGINFTIGIFRPGGWAEYVIVPEEQLHKLTPSITLEHAALAEPFSCITHGWDLANPIKIGKRILITGAGIIGNLWASVLHLHGHRDVTISEPNATRLEKVKNLGFGFKTVTPEQLKKEQAADPNFKFDVAIDCSGFPPAIEHALTLLDKGGKLVIFGVSPPHGRVSLSPYDVYNNELTIQGVFINPHSFPNSIGLLESLGEKYLNFDKLGVKIYKLDEYKEALEALKTGSISKAVFKL